MPFGSSQWMYSSGFYPTVIDQSLMFDGTAYLSRTPSVAGDRKTWTWSGWLKLGDVTTTRRLFMATQGANINSTGDMSFVFNTSGALIFQQDAASGVNFTTTAVYRDPSAWYNFVLVFDSTDGTANDRCKIYVNGVRQEGTNNGTITSNLDGYVNTTNFHTIGMWQATNQPYDGYLADTYFVDGTALDPTSFGEFKNGVWIPKRYTGSYGTNGFHLEYDSNANDSSGTGNNWTATNIVAGDYMLDSPTNNYATLNPLAVYVVTPTDGNLKFSGDSAGGHGTIGATVGKYYWEVTYSAIGSGDGAIVGIRSMESIAGGATRNVGYYGGGTASGSKIIDSGAATAYAAAWTTGDVIGVALNLDDGNVTFYKNNVSQGAISFSVSGLSWTSFNWRTGVANSANTTRFTYTPPWLPCSMHCQSTRA
jgi:hypothetical protein